MAPWFGQQQSGAVDVSQCPAFSVTDPMPSIQCNVRKDAIYLAELIVLVIITLYGLKLLFPAVHDRVVQAGNSVQKGAQTAAEVGAAALA